MVISSIFLVVTVPVVARAQGRVGSDSPLAQPAASNTIIQPQLLNANTNPTLRFPVAWASLTLTSASYGWLDISQEEIRFTNDQPRKNQEAGFSVAAAEIRELKLEDHSRTVTFRHRHVKRTVFYVPRENWGITRDSRALLALRNEGMLGTQEIYRTLMDFDAMLALAKSPRSPTLPVVSGPVGPAAPAAGPTAAHGIPVIVMLSPSVAGDNQTVEWQDSPLVVRGTAMDSSGLLVIRINGSPANMRPQNTQAVEFWSDPLPLKAGANSIQIAAVNSSHAETRITFTVYYSPQAAPVKPRALDKAQIIGLLRGSVAPTRVAEIVGERGISFVPTAEDLKEIRRAGGNDELIQAIQQATPPE